MHDLTFAKEIIRAVEIKMKTLAANEKVTSVTCSLSPLSHVRPEALQGTFAALVKGTRLESVRLLANVRAIPMRCLSCGAIFYAEKPVFSCEKCQSADIEISDNREFMVDAVDVKREGPDA